MKRLIIICCCIFLFILIDSYCFSMTFEEADFEKLILDQPVMNDYDNQTGHFKNSTYKLYDVEQLKKELIELDLKLEELKKNETKLASQSVEFDEATEEENFWNTLKADSQQIKDIEDKIIEINSLIYSNGETDYSHLFTIVTKMAKDAILPLYDKKKIVFNKLPKYYPNTDKTTKLRNKFVFNNQDSLKEYIKIAPSFASIFPDSDKTILFNNYNTKTNEIGTIDLTLVLMLHPNMALFNFMNKGFYNYNYGLSEEEILEKNQSNMNLQKAEPKELKDLKKRLEDLYSQKMSFLNNLDNPAIAKEYSDFLSKYNTEKVRLQQNIFDSKYSNYNPELTSPTETIKIIEKIYQDINAAINEVLREKNIKVLLNTSLPISFGYNVQYPSTCIKGLGHAGINYILFYSYYNTNYLDGPFKEFQKDIFQRRRFKLINENTKKYVLPLNPYPVVLSGGNSILSDVTKKIYDKYNIDKSAYAVLDSVISKIEAFQNGLDY